MDYRQLWYDTQDVLKEWLSERGIYITKQMLADVWICHNSKNDLLEKPFKSYKDALAFALEHTQKVVIHDNQ